MANVGKYNLAEVNFVWGAVIAEGLAVDEAIKITWEDDHNSVFVSGDGRPTRVVKNNRAATITLNVAQTSATNAHLSAQYALQEAGAVSPFLAIESLEHGQLFTSTSCWVKRPPEPSYGSDVGEWTWTFQVGSLTAVFGVPVVIDSSQA